MCEIEAGHEWERDGGMEGSGNDCWWDLNPGLRTYGMALSPQNHRAPTPTDLGDLVVDPATQAVVGEWVAQ